MQRVQPRLMFRIRELRLLHERRMSNRNRLKQLQGETFAPWFFVSQAVGLTAKPGGPPTVANTSYLCQPVHPSPPAIHSATQQNPHIVSVLLQGLPRRESVHRRSRVHSLNSGQLLDQRKERTLK